MPDDTTNVQHPIYQLARDFLQLLTLVFAFYSANIGNRNHDKIESVEQRQAEVVVKQDEAAVRADHVKNKLDERSAEDVRAQGVALYSNWKYLDDVAANGGSAKDKTKAAEAKQAYEDHVRRYQK